MNNYPAELEKKEPLELKLGIKSSLAKVKSSLALIYFFWVSSKSPSKLLYSKETFDNSRNTILILEDLVRENLRNYLLLNSLIKNEEEFLNLEKLIIENPLFCSQIEALKVGFELIWKIGFFNYEDEKLSFSSERQKIRGKSVRYNKIISFSSNLDLLKLFVEQDKETYEKCLFNWASGVDNPADTREESLIKLFTMMSDEAIYRLRIDENTDIKFNMSGVYRSLSEGNDDEVVLHDFKENMGSLRILHSILREEFNSFLEKKDPSYRSYGLKQTVSKDEVLEYAKRVSTHFELSNIDLTIINSAEITDYLEKEAITKSLNVEITYPHQRIFFGAPGTGKSFKLNEQAKENFGSNFERVTFHPNYMYGNFVGAYKPFPKVLKDKDGNVLKDEHGNIDESITYKYVEGVFMRSLVKAFRNPECNFLVIIEEINRANVAAVFGDLFQLLDRDGNGKSEYKIATSKELQEYLRKEDKNEPFDATVKTELGDDFSSLYLPSNFYLWATMNSADQGVMPMDTAFRRRWEFTYLGIDEAVDDSFEDFMIKISENEIAKWDDFRRAVNAKLSACRIPEDKLIGPYFIPKSILELKDHDKLTIIVRDKVLLYLYEDAGKAHRNTIFAEGKHNTYSMVCDNFMQNAISLFKDNLELKTERILKESKESIGESDDEDTEDQIELT